MNKKLLSFALTSALMALVIVPSAYAATTAGTSGTVGVTIANEGVTIAVAGEMDSATFAVNAITSRATDTNTLVADTDYFEVHDNTGNTVAKAGHHVFVKMNSGSWTYSGENADYGNIDLVSEAVAAASPGNDQMSFRIVGSTGTIGFTTDDSNICSANGGVSNMIDDIYVGTDDAVLAETDETCAGTTRYNPATVGVIAPLNGLGDGSYTISGTLTVADGPSQG